MSDARLERLGGAARVTVYSEVILPPVTGKTDYPGFNLGAYTSDGQPLVDFRLRRKDLTETIETVEPEFPETSKRMDVAATYGGMIDFHFGHFMLETLSRQWWLRRVTNGPIIWHRQVPWELQPWQAEIFGLCGLDIGRFAYVSEPIIAREIAVPEPGLVHAISYLPLWAEALGVFPFQPPSIRKRVWLSRSKLPAHFGHVEEELEIEEKLSSLGWKIVHPHLMSNVELLYFIADAETISGFAASAYFVLLLARDCRAKIRMVDRGGMGNPPVFEHYASAKNLRQEIMRPKLEHVSGVGGKATYRLESIESVIDFVNT
jgi:hypothetical protein